MTIPTSAVGMAVLFAVTPALFGQTAVPDTVGWLPITAQEWQTNAPAVEKDAGVEGLFWRVHVSDETQSGEVRRIHFNYVRLKVFNEKGKEKAATIEIAMDKDVGIPFLSGRTVKSDGTVLELKKDAIFEREVARIGGSRQRVKSFAMPGVEPGVIVEYRWQEVRWTGHYISTYIRMPMQREYPIRKVTYFIKPLPRDQIADGLGMRVASFNCTPSPLKQEDDGFSSISLDNVPAFQQEPFAPSNPNIQPWALAFYTDPRTREPEAFWDDVGRKEYRRIKETLRVSDEMKKAAADATTGAQTDDQKVLALLGYLRGHFKNLWDREVDEATRNKILDRLAKNPRTTAEVFKSGIGTADEMNNVFAAMATAVRLEARPALIANQNERAFAPTIMTRYFLNSVDMAVKLGDQWKIFDVTARRLPPGMLSWAEEGVYALVSDPKKPEFIQTPISPPESSHTTRNARLTLASDGGISGEAVETLTGHDAMATRAEMESESAERRQEIVKDRVHQVFATAEISGVKVENLEDPSLPVMIHYQIKVPGYAQRTGTRILFYPFFFERGMAPRFSASQRRHPIMFQHAWKETDRVSIQLPEGFQLDNAEKPGDLSFGEVGQYTIRIGVEGGKQLVAERELVFGNKGRLYFDAKAYSTLKQVFDTIYNRDNHTISLKQAAGTQ